MIRIIKLNIQANLALNWKKDKHTAQLRDKAYPIVKVKRRPKLQILSQENKLTINSQKRGRRKLQTKRDKRRVQLEENLNLAARIKGFRTR